MSEADLAESFWNSQEMGINALMLYLTFLYYKRNNYSLRSFLFWLAIWCGSEIGWVDFDPTNGLIPSDEHVTVGWGRDYGDVSPINGFILGGGEHDVIVEVDVDPAP